MKFTKKEKRVLTEVVRRVSKFCAINGVNSNLILLETPSEVKTLIGKGILKVHGKEIARYLNWYNLTEEGKELIKPRVNYQISDETNKRMFCGEMILEF